MPIVRVRKNSGGVRSRGGRAAMKQRIRGAQAVRMSPASRMYLKSLLNPSYGGAKIPDAYGAKTCTIQLQREIRIARSSNGIISAVMQISNAPFVWRSDTAGTGWTNVGFVDGSTTYDTVTGQVASKLPQLFRSGRVVSAGVKAQFVGTTQNDQGTMTVYALDRSHLQGIKGVEVGGAVGVTTTATIGNPEYACFAIEADPLTTPGNGDGCRNVPVNAYGPVRLGCVARYYPIDDADLEFAPYRPQLTAALATNDALRVGTVGALGFVCENTGTDAAVIVQFTVNLECIVRDDSFHLISSEASPIDTRGMGAVAAVYTKKPQVKVGVAGDTESINVYSR